MPDQGNTEATPVGILAVVQTTLGELRPLVKTLQILKEARKHAGALGITFPLVLDAASSGIAAMIVATELMLQFPNGPRRGSAPPPHVFPCGFAD
jgi:hypothetical protein